MKKTTEADSRKPYDKPVIRSINLVGEEVLAVGCKLAVGTGPFASNCTVLPCSVNRGS